MSAVAFDLRLEHRGTTRAQVSRTTIAAAALLAVLNVADVITTRMVLSYPHAIEQNPVARALLGNFKIDVFKVAVCAFLAFKTLRSPANATVKWACSLWFVNGYYVMTILNNILTLAALDAMHR
jgi:hypothetical protein